MKQLYAMQEATDTGSLQVNVTSRLSNAPVRDAEITISYSGEPDSILESVETDESGQTREVELETPPLQYSEAPNEPRPYKNYILEIQADGYETALIIGVEMFPDVTAIQNVQLRNQETGRALLNRGAGTTVHLIIIPPHTLYREYPPKIP